MSSPAETRTAPHEFLVESTRGPVESAEQPPAVDGVSTAEWIQSILDRFEGPLLRYARRITGDLELARDVVQETLLQVCRHDRTSLEDRLAPWLFQVCRHRALDVQRKEHRMSAATDLDLHTLPGGSGPPELLARRETTSRLISLLDALTANQQEVIRLKFQNDLSYREIAEITGLTVSYVGVLLHTGLKRLRELMKDHDSA